MKTRAGVMGEKLLGGISYKSVWEQEGEEKRKKKLC